MMFTFSLRTALSTEFLSTITSLKIGRSTISTFSLITELGFLEYRTRRPAAWRICSHRACTDLHRSGAARLATSTPRTPRTNNTISYHAWRRCPRWSFCRKGKDQKRAKQFWRHCLSEASIQHAWNKQNHTYCKVGENHPKTKIV